MQKIHFYFILMLAMMVSAGVVAAQEQDTTDSLVFEVEGEVTVLEDDLIMIGDFVVAPAGSFNPSELEVGDYVVVSGTLLNDDTLQASDLEVVEDGEEAVEEADEDGEEVNEEEIVTEGDHPVGTALATTFDIEYDTVQEWHDSGLGYGQIGSALLLADQVEDVTYEDAVEMVQNGENLNQVAREYGLSPSDLATGQVISGRYTSDSAEDSDAGYVSAGTTVNIRAGAGTDSEILGTLEPGDEFTIVGEEDGWYVIELEDGTMAYIFADLAEEGEVPEGGVVSDEPNLYGGVPTGDTNNGGTAGNNGNDGLNKFGCEGRGNSCNTPANENRNNGNNGGGNGNGNGNGGGNGKGRGN
jgi:uncharacterized protein YraI